MDWDTVLARFGSCTLPRNKLLWTWQPEGFQVPNHEVFTYVSPEGMQASGEHYSLLTRRALRLVAPWDITVSGSSVSLLPQLYTAVTGRQWAVGTDEVPFKQSVSARQPLLRALDALGIDGWLHPVQSSPWHIEACLVKAAARVRKVPPTDQLDAVVRMQPGHYAHELGSHSLQALRS